jgi:hypothetical protein
VGGQAGYKILYFSSFGGFWGMTQQNLKRTNYVFNGFSIKFWLSRRTILFVFCTHLGKYFTHLVITELTILLYQNFLFSSATTSIL